MVLDGDHPWVVVAPPGAAKVFSAVTHSSSAFHNNQQEKNIFCKYSICPEKTFSLYQCHWRGICSQYADVPTLLEKSARNNAKFCQIESRRRGAYRARRQLVCPEWHFLKEGKKQKSLTGILPLPSNQKQNVGPLLLLAQYKPCGLGSCKSKRVQPIVCDLNQSWPKVWKMCRRFEDCLVSRTGFRIFVISVLVIFVAALGLNFGQAKHPLLVWCLRKNPIRIYIFILQWKRYLNSCYQNSIIS